MWVFFHYAFCKTLLEIFSSEWDTLRTTGWQREMFLSEPATFNWSFLKKENGGKTGQWIWAGLCTLYFIYWRNGAAFHSWVIYNKTSGIRWTNVYQISQLFMLFSNPKDGGEIFSCLYHWYLLCFYIKLVQLEFIGKSCRFLVSIVSFVIVNKNKIL